ncbi:plant UBX domain-containing protein 1 isoform X1 [Ananas comosus]|uniref:Plant UBX domain-containing protein 1 isoform X1 n=2 Tax=Ananas comosus TaxID=4615 RepID=A0A6P5GWN2_ANACO|nr:plant UBX domain-containing protein 1 isoform X1 [Ananas comosus]
MEAEEAKPFVHIISLKPSCKIWKLDDFGLWRESGGNPVYGKSPVRDRLLAISEELGHEIRVFMNSPNSAAPNETPPHDEEPDDFYDFTPEDYFRLMGDRIGAQSQVLKTRKIREAEAAARRARITKAVIRVRFPDNYVFEAKFQPSDKIQSLIDLLTKAIARPNVPFYLYTTPPKERIKDTSKDFYSAGFAPGAIVYFSYDLPKDSELNSEALTGPYLREDIRSLNGLELPSKQEQADPANSQPEAPVIEAPPPASDPNPAPKKPTKPKWLKL